jgi:2-phosphoglycolate phosphatase
LKLDPHYLLFDLDGTLVDTAPDLGYAANRVRQEQGLPPLALDAYRPYASGGARGMLKVALGLTPDDPVYVQRKARFLAHYREHLAVDSRLFPGIADLLETLERARLRWGIVTNKVAEFSLPLLEHLGLAQRCACLISGDSAPRPKPAPDPLLLAAQKLGAAPSAGLYVGDDERDILAGRAARMRTAAAGWGYLGERPDPQSWAADLVVATPSELIARLHLPRAA